MHCFDCAALGRDTASTAICQECGAALCHQHTVTVEREVRRAAGTGRATSPVPARRLTCQVCHQAHQAAY
jgi:hypothetical protein